jgi:hypothetical protein
MRNKRRWQLEEKRDKQANAHRVSQSWRAAPFCVGPKYAVFGP